MSKHTIIASGYVGKDAECRFTPAGKPVTNFPLAVDIGYGDSKGVLWFRVAVWGERAVKLAPHIVKGTLMWVTGELSEPRIYQGRDGESRVSLDLRASDVAFLSSKGERQAEEMGGDGDTGEETVPF
jgi:single-strand DNA-binding protein